jgi:hypothetical protein
MKDGSMEMDYCQGIVLSVYDSNMRRGSGVDGRSCGEFGSLVRRSGADGKEGGEKELANREGSCAAPTVLAGCVRLLSQRLRAGLNCAAPTAL